jgi:hypothetical protein
MINGFRLTWVNPRNPEKVGGYSFFASPIDAQSFIETFDGYTDEERKRFYAEHFGCPLVMMTDQGEFILEAVSVSEKLFPQGFISPQHRGRRLVAETYPRETPADMLTPDVWVVDIRTIKAIGVQTIAPIYPELPELAELPKPRWRAGPGGGDNPRPRPRKRALAVLAQH